MPKSIKSLPSKLALRLVGGLALFMLLLGTVVYHYSEGFNWLDSAYFSTVTLATVGYGDYVPHTNFGKIFTIFYILVGIGIIVTLANVFVRRAGERIIERRTARAKRKK